MIHRDESPAERRARLAEIRQAVAAGTYETPERLCGPRSTFCFQTSCFPTACFPTLRIGRTLSTSPVAGLNKSSGAPDIPQRLVRRSAPRSFALPSKCPRDTPRRANPGPCRPVAQLAPARRYSAPACGRSLQVGPDAPAMQMTSHVAKLENFSSPGITLSVRAVECYYRVAGCPGGWRRKKPKFPSYPPGNAADVICNQ